MVRVYTVLVNYMSIILVPTVSHLYSYLCAMIYFSRSAGVPHIPSLRELRLSGCGIRAAGASMIASFLATNETLESLDLSYNMMEATGAELIAKVSVCCNPCSQADDH
jgi:Leucine Rich repeat